MRIELDKYQASNLRWALQQIVAQSKLGRDATELNTGQWAEEVLAKLEGLGDLVISPRGYRYADSSETYSVR